MACTTQLSLSTAKITSERRNDMTKKDYEAIAAALRDSFDRMDARYQHEDNKAIVADICYEVCDSLGEVFQADNMRFNLRRFIIAVTGE